MPLWTQAILGIWIVWGAAWLAAWRHANRTLTRATRDVELPYRLINIAGFVALFAVPVGGVGRGAWPLRPLWQLAPPAGWALAAVALAGMGLALAARLTLGRLWSAAVTRKQAHHIVDHGPYGLVRHPIYTAIITGAWALALAKATPLALAGALLLAIGYVVKARVEERFLATELGPAAYEAYRARVPMLVPFARRLARPVRHPLGSPPRR